MGPLNFDGAPWSIYILLITGSLIVIVGTIIALLAVAKLGFNSSKQNKQSKQPLSTINKVSSYLVALAIDIGIVLLILNVVINPAAIEHRTGGQYPFLIVVIWLAVGVRLLSRLALHVTPGEKIIHHKQLPNRINYSLIALEIIVAVVGYLYILGQPTTF